MQSRLSVLLICACFVALLSSLSACTSQASTFSNDPKQIKVLVPKLRLFSHAGVEGRALRTLKKGELLEDLGEVSPFLTPLTLSGRSYVEPWLKVRSAKGEIAWVYGAVLYNQAGEAAPLILSKRAAALFGTSLANKISSYQQHYEAAQDEQELANAYHQFREILDSLALHTSFALAVDPAYRLPELSWLPQILPAVVLQKNHNGDSYYFFTHFGQYQQKALQTQGQNDEAFFGWCLQQYPSDSIEYLFPKYIIETEAEKGHSLLGRGLHLQALQQLDALYRRKTPFESDLIAAKNRCIDDITASRAAFWETQDKIIAELTQICDSDLAILTKADNIALKTRLQQMQDPEKYGLKTDVQAGRTN